MWQKRRNVSSIKKLVAGLVANMPKPAKEKLGTVELKDLWAAQMGCYVAKHTKKIFIKNGTLFIYTHNRALCDDLTYRRTEIMEKVASKLKDVTINRIFLG